MAEHDPSDVHDPAADDDPSEGDAAVGPVHEWVSIEVDDETFQFDLSFLTSSWTCIYGAGCPGIEDHPAPELARGCCTHGAHFTEKADRKRVARKLEALGPDEWQLHDEAEAAGGPIWKDPDQDAWVTRTHDGACILLNRPDFPGGAGCALHAAALRRDERPLDWKPTVCWQLPLRVDYHTDDNGHLTTFVRDWRRRDWGEGGEDFHWWCTEEADAFVGEVPVVTSLRDDLVELVGAAAYQALVDHLEDRLPATPLAEPSVRRRDLNKRT